MKLYLETDGGLVIGQSVITRNSSVELLYSTDNLRVRITPINGSHLFYGPITELTDSEGASYANRTALEKAIKGFFGNGVLEVLSITDNVSEAFVATTDSVVIQVQTSDASTITFLRSIDGINFSTIPDVSMTVNDSIDEINLIDLKVGQSFKVSSTGTMTSCKVLL